MRPGLSTYRHGRCLGQPKTLGVCNVKLSEEGVRSKVKACQLEELKVLAEDYLVEQTASL